MSEIIWMVRLRKASSLAIMSARAALSRWMSLGVKADETDEDAAIEAAADGRRPEAMLLMSRVSISASN